MAGDTRKVPRPPQPPEVGRKLRFHLVQAIGVPLLAVIPILALFYVFGTTHDTDVALEQPVQLEVRYPTRFRYKTIQPLDVTVRNLGDTALAGVSIWVDRSYVEAFSTVGFTPAPRTITNDAYVFDLGEIPPGESRIVDGMVQAERYWRHPGWITVRTAGGTDATLEIATFTFP